MQKRKKSDLSRHSSSSRLSAAKLQKAAENAHTDAADRSQRRRSKTLQRAAFCYARRPKLLSRPRTFYLVQVC